MIRTGKLLIGLSIISIFSACSSDDDSDYERGNWVTRSVFDGVPRSNAIGFAIDGNGYMGTGYDGDDYMNDFWEYNIEGNYWVQKADFPGVPRSAATGFNIDSKGYVGIGYSGTTELSDFWEYDPFANSWTQKQDFLGGERRAAIGFGVNGMGYMGTGYDGENDKKDFYKYNPNLDEWSELVGFGGNKRRYATAFTIDNLVYIGTGVSNGLYKTDFWEFDPETEVFTAKNSLIEEDEYTIARSNTVSFSHSGLGYITTGYNGGVVSTTWEYTPYTDTWEEITSLEGTSRQDAVGFSTGESAFVLMGKSGSLYLDDIYELFPQQEYDDED
jgi:N-acetylneuraminic acid mutarotase